MLAAAGATVVTAENGQVGVDKALAERFDLILMDMQMPVLDGFRATQRLREQGLAVPIVALTAHALAEELDRCLDAGCSACLSKPIEASLLVNTLHGIVAQGRPSQTASEQTLDGVAPHPAEVVSSGRDESIRSSLPPGFNDIVCQFVPRLKQLVRDLRAAFDERDLATVRRLSHSLRGSAGTAGFHSFTEPAQRLSQAVGASDWPDAALTLAEIERLADRVVSPQPDCPR
jgi:CheY-like chemotaxis protein